MKKVGKWILITIGVMASLFTMTIFAAFINHKIQLTKEDKRFIPNGEMVEVNGHNMHVYKEGNGEETVVFMAGGGTSAPVFDFKSLYSLLSDTYTIAVVEKTGYGFSDVTDTVRDIDTILSETREALEKAGVEGPYILAPHSMSGIEALYWAQQHPEEVKAIVGLDMAVPDVYEMMDINMPLIRLGAFVANTGIFRWIPGLSESDAIKYGALTEEEKELSRLIFHRRTSTKNMVNEVVSIKENAKKVKEGAMPSVPMLLFSSNGEGTGWDENTWNDLQKDFIQEQGNGKLTQLDGSHFIHNMEYEQIAEESNNFIEGLEL